MTDIKKLHSIVYGKYRIKVLLNKLLTRIIKLMDYVS